MKKILYSITLCFLFIACNKEEKSPEISTPTYTPASEIDPVITSSVDEFGYTVLDELFVGSWNRSTILSGDGNVVMVGSASSSFSKRKITLAKTDTSGEIIYYRTVFNNQYGAGVGLCEDLNQNIYAVGYTLGEDGLQNRILAVTKISADGNILWENNYHPNEEDITGYNISELSNGEILVSGLQDGNLVFLKIDESGEEILFEIKESSSYDSPNGMLILEDGRILITSTNGEAIQLSWYDEDLNLLKKKSFGSRISHGRSTIQLSDGDLLSVGHFTHTTGGTNVIDSQAVLLIKVDIEGDLIWESKVGNLEYLNNGQSIKENADGTFVLTGYAEENHMLIYVDLEGNEINAKYYLDDKTFRGQNIIKLENGRNIVTGGYQGGMFFLNVDNYGM